MLIKTRTFLVQVIDLLVRLLQCSFKEGEDESHMIRIFKEAYDVLHAYMIGKSRKNALYFAKYIDFFQTQFTQKVWHLIIFYNIVFTKIFCHSRHHVETKFPDYCDLCYKQLR